MKKRLICGCLVAAGAAFGACDRPTGELQQKAQALADYAIASGMQGALQFCALVDGKCVIDVWAGTMTTNACAAKIDGDTLFPIFSTEKPILATAVHRTVELGKIGYDQKVSTFWPEFTGGGKENRARPLSTASSFQNAIHSILAGRLRPRITLSGRSGRSSIRPSSTRLRSVPSSSRVRGRRSASARSVLPDALRQR